MPLSQPLDGRIEHDAAKRLAAPQRTVSSPAKQANAAAPRPTQTRSAAPDREAIDQMVRDHTGAAFAVAELVMRPWFEAQAQMVRMMKQFIPPLPLPGYAAPLSITADTPAWERLLNPMQLSLLPVQQMPESDLAECRNCYELTVDLPGVPPDEIEVRCGLGVIMVVGERREEIEGELLGLALAERRFGRFERTFALPSDADACSSQASYHDGVLLIRAPKLKTDKDGLVKVPIEH